VNRKTIIVKTFGFAIGLVITALVSAPRVLAQASPVYVGAIGDAMSYAMAIKGHYGYVC